MKYYDTKFEEYLQSYLDVPLNNKNKNIYNKFPERLNDLPNLIFYGPDGVGKYTQSLASIYKYSASKLNYEKKICITYNKQPYYIKISDIHFEIDMSLLGCNTKMLWNEIYNNIVDIVLAKPGGIGIIICKNFQDINNELLDTFYSYMQTNNTVPIKIIFVFLTSQVSFIPDNIIERCKIINVTRPSRIQYSKCTKKSVDELPELSKITNIKDLYAGVTELSCSHSQICNKVIDNIINIKQTSFINIREDIYNILIYNLNIWKCIIYIIHQLIHKKKFKHDDISDIFKKTVHFLQYYNNNYRPIYHLESFILYLTSLVHGYKKSE